VAATLLVQQAVRPLWWMLAVQQPGKAKNYALLIKRPVEHQYLFQTPHAAPQAAVRQRTTPVVKQLKIHHSLSQISVTVLLKPVAPQIAAQQTPVK
jgi:hypothetical protein